MHEPVQTTSCSHFQPHQTHPTQCRALDIMLNNVNLNWVELQKVTLMHFDFELLNTSQPLHKHVDFFFFDAQKNVL